MLSKLNSVIELPLLSNMFLKFTSALNEQTCFAHPWLSETVRVSQSD